MNTKSILVQNKDILYIQIERVNLLKKKKKEQIIKK